MTVKTTTKAGEQTYNSLANREVFLAPPEAQYQSFQKLWDDASAQRSRSEEHVINLRDAVVLPGTDEQPERLTLLRGDVEFKAKLTNYSYKQIARVAGVPLQMVERLKPDTRAKVINELMPRGDDRVAQVLLENTGGDQEVRAFTGSQYSRLWDADVCAELDRWLAGSGWEPAKPTFRYAGDDSNAPRALSRTDRSSFMFFMKNGDPGDDFGGLHRGLAVWNSEIGDRMFGWTSFLFRDICGNLLIWGMREQTIKQVVHRKGIIKGFDEFRADCVELSGAVTDEEFSFIQRAAEVEFAPDVERAEQRLNKFGLTREASKKAVELSQSVLGTGDLSVWGVTNGITAYANTLQHGYDRIEYQKKAGEVLTEAMAG